MFLFRCSLLETSHNIPWRHLQCPHKSIVHVVYPIISVVYTVNSTEWPYMCWRTVKNLLTHSLTQSLTAACRKIANSLLFSLLLKICKAVGEHIAVSALTLFLPLFVTWLLQHCIEECPFKSTVWTLYSLLVNCWYTSNNTSSRNWVTHWQNSATVIWIYHSRNYTSTQYYTGILQGPCNDCF